MLRAPLPSGGFASYGLPGPGRYITIYPEGHLMAIGERERYRSGIYYMARDFGLLVTPVATCVGLLWNRRDWTKKPEPWLGVCLRFQER